jgi:hypothetical protein
MTWGRVAIGRDITVGVVVPRSCIVMISLINTREYSMSWTDLLQQISSQHQNLSVGPKALDSSQISHSLLMVFGRRHDLEYVE